MLSENRFALFGIMLYQSGEGERYMHHTGFALRRHRQSTMLENLQHRGVFGQDLRDEFVQAALARQLPKMTHQDRSEPLSLVIVDHRKRDFGPAGLCHDVASAAYNRLPSVRFRDRHQRHVIDEVDVEEKVEFLLAEFAANGEEAAEQGLCAGAFNRRKQGIPVARPQGADFNPSTVAQCFDCRIARRMRHGR